MLSCKRNLATDQVLLVGVTAGSPLCLEEMQLRCCQEEGRLQLVLAGAALLRHCFPCPLSSVSLCAVVFLGVHSPWSLVPPRQRGGFLEDQELQSCCIGGFRLRHL